MVTLRDCAARGAALNVGARRQSSQRRRSWALLLDGTKVAHKVRNHQNQLFPTRADRRHGEVRIHDFEGDIARMNRRALIGESLDGLACAVAQEAIDVSQHSVTHPDRD
jgi:hypothetical protein